MKMFRNWSLIVLLCGVISACSSSEEPQQPMQQLPAPECSITTNGLEASVRWNKHEYARQYDWELEQDGVITSGSSYTASYDFTMQEGSSYRFRVRAIAAKGSAWSDSPWSAYVTATSNMLPTPEPIMSPDSPTETTAQIGWPAVDGAAAYRYELREGESAQVAQSGRVEECLVNLEGLTAGTDYRFRLMAESANAATENSSWSPDLRFTTRSEEQLSTPVLTLKRVTTSEALLAWEAVKGAAGYSICYRLADNIDESITELKTASTECTIEGLQEATSYVAYAIALADEKDPYTTDSAPSERLNFTTRSSSAVELSLPLAWEDDGVIRAFPGAEGGGMYTTGGRGGEVYHVTTLADSGQGSLRDAVSKSNRTIVFDVCGTIHLKSDLKIGQKNLTLAGQTAPGDGICLADATVQISADNIIIRYLRFRLGDQGANLSDGSDAIWGRYNSNIILDHCSMSWSVDEVASFYANCNFTMQWCLIGEALRASAHGKGNHGYGGIWGGKNASFHHNMLTCNDSRNARIDHPEIYGNYISTHRGNVDYRNNLIYNWGSEVTYGGEGGWFNIVGNYYKRGPASQNRTYFVDAYGFYEKDGVTYTDSYGQFYIDGNVNPDQPTITADNTKGIYWKNGSGYGHYNEYLAQPLAIRFDDRTDCYTSTHTADEAYEKVLDYVGASLARDAVDVRLVGDARAGKATYTDGGNGSKNGLIDTQSAVGGWPELKATDEQIARAATDTDKDGIPDYYENLLGLNPNDSADARAVTLDPAGLYPNLEVYLHFLTREITQAQVSQATYTRLQ